MTAQTTGQPVVPSSSPAAAMRWVFIRPRNQSPYYDPEMQEPLGIEYLSAAAHRRGEAVLLLDSALDRHSDVVLARRAVSFAPGAIGFSITTAQEVDSVLAIREEASRSLAGKAVHWLAGGNFVTSEPLQARRMLGSAFRLVRFEGELALDELSRNWSSDGGRLPGEQTVCGKGVVDLDQLPFADRPYARQILEAGWAFNIQGSRGCCGACRYCSSPGMMGASSGRWRGRSIGNIVQEIQHLHDRFGARSFNFIDEDFLGPNRVAPARAAEFAQGIGRWGQRVSFGIQVRPDSLSGGVIDALLAVGLTYVFMGIESDDPDDLRRWGRPWRTEPWPWVRLLRSGGAEVNAGVLMWHPEATPAGVRRFAQRLREHGLLEYRSAINRLDAMPGSAMHAEAAAAGQIAPDLSGPQPLPFRHAAMEAIHGDVLAALAPLGPPSMHALCSLPGLLARRYLEGQAPEVLIRLMDIIRRQDHVVGEAFFAVLRAHETASGTKTVVDDLRRRNLDVAVATSQDLVRHGLAPSVEALREAIRIDAGL